VSLHIEFDIDIRDLVTLDNIEAELKLGPNSSFLYCFNFLEKNLNWLTDKLVAAKGAYFIFDTPGQIEIYTVSPSFKAIVKRLSGLIQLSCVNLIESINIVDMSKYIFSIFSVLNAMINLELPQVNIISKIDIIKGFDDIPFPLSFYKNPNDSEQLQAYINEANINPKFKKLNTLISEFVVDYGLVSFDILDVKDQRLLNRVASLIDKANGFIYHDTGRLQDEKYIEVRNEIAKNELEYDDDDEYLNN
jgi:hypothetical protein